MVQIQWVYLIASPYARLKLGHAEPGDPEIEEKDRSNGSDFILARHNRIWIRQAAHIRHAELNHGSVSHCLIAQ
jgi:hypothetical protein